MRHRRTGKFSHVTQLIGLIFLFFLLVLLAVLAVRLFFIATIS